MKKNNYENLSEEAIKRVKRNKLQRKIYHVTYTILLCFIFLFYLLLSNSGIGFIIAITVLIAIIFIYPKFVKKANQQNRSILIQECNPQLFEEVMIGMYANEKDKKLKAALAINLARAYNAKGEFEKSIEKLSEENLDREKVSKYYSLVACDILADAYTGLHRVELLSQLKKEKEEIINNGKTIEKDKEYGNKLIKKIDVCIAYVRNDFSTVKKYLKEYFEKDMNAQEEAGYHFAKGYIAMLEGDSKQAQEDFKESLEIADKLYISKLAKRYSQVLKASEGKIFEMKPEQTEKVMNIWLTSTIKAHYFIEKEYWESHYEEVKTKYMPHSKNYIYEQDGEILGFISIMDRNTVGALFVKNESQNQGIGSLLLQYATTLYSNLSLNVYSKNEKAVEFYKKHGFETRNIEINKENKQEEFYMIQLNNSVC